MNLGGKTLVADMSLHKPGGLSMNDPSAVLAMQQEMTIGSKQTSAYQTNAAGQTNDLGNSNKVGEIVRG